MTVAELIVLLQAEDPEAEAVAAYGYDGPERIGGLRRAMFETTKRRRPLGRRRWECVEVEAGRPWPPEGQWFAAVELLGADGLDV